MTDAEKPRWWLANEEVKEAFDLPPYEPPRFADDTYTHEVVPDLEREFDCSIRFVGVDPRYPDDWEVRVDGRSVTEVGRRRDKHGNTVYGTTSREFAARIREELED